MIQHPDYIHHRFVYTFCLEVGTFKSELKIKKSSIHIILPCIFYKSEQGGIGLF